MDDPYKAIAPEHDYVLEHAYYKRAIAEKWEGWENVRWTPMDVAQLGVKTKPRSERGRVEEGE